MRTLLLLMVMLIPMLGGRLGGAPELLPAQLEGIDVSHHQKKIDWAAVVSEEMPQFAFVKATEGADFVDSLFCHNWESLRRFGIRRGAYHFFHAYGCGVDQARNFLQNVEMAPGDLPPVLDIETTDGMPPEVMLEEARVWLQEVEKRLGIKPIIYTNQNFYEKYLAGLFDNHPLWIAKYDTERPELSSGARWQFWQYSNAGRFNGVNGNIDRNIFAGTSDMLDKLRWNPHPASTPVEAAP